MAAISAAGARPAVPQAMFVTLYAAFWFTTVILPGLGRPERILAIIGLVGVPFTVSMAPRVALVPPMTVSLGLVGMLVTYVIAYMSNEPSPEAYDYMLALASRATFLWLAFVHLQHRVLLERTTRLLILSSLAACGFAIVIMGIFGIGAGRASIMVLRSTIGEDLIEIFAAAQWATMGGILLIGMGPRLVPRLRRLAPAGAILIFVVAYVTYFRRQFLVTAPIVLGAMLLTLRSRRVNTLVVAIAFVSLAGLEYTRDGSLLRTRLVETGGSFVDSEEVRISTAVAQWEAISERPGSGHGPGNHVSALARYTRVEERFLAGYNIYGWLAVEGGVPCLFFYLLIPIGVVAEAWRTRKQSGDTPEGVVLRCGPVIVLQILLWGMFGNAWESALSWFLMGMVLAAARIADANPDSKQPAVTPFRSSVPRMAGSA